VIITHPVALLATLRIEIMKDPVRRDADRQVARPLQEVVGVAREKVVGDRGAVGVELDAVADFVAVVVVPGDAGVELLRLLGR
jgi:hypothetical protein